MPRKEKVNLDYDSTAPVYDATRSFWEKGYGGAREIEQTHPFITGPLILSVATGTGRTLPSHSTKGQTVAIDLSLGMMQIAKKKSKHTWFLRCDAENLPFQDGIFDTLYCSRAVKYFLNIGKFFGEAGRCLKKEGFLVVVAETSDPLWVRLAVKLELMDFFDVRFRSTALENFARKAGFKLISKGCIFYFPHYFYELAPRFVTDIIRLFEQRRRTGKGVMFAFAR